MTDQHTTRALLTYARLAKSGQDALLIRRTDHPHVAGDYYYAILASDKRLWTNGETALNADERRDLWYANGCPTDKPRQEFEVVIVR